MARATPTPAATLLDGLPMWARVVTVLGAPTAAAGYLIWQAAKFLPVILAALQSMQTDAALAHHTYETHMVEDARKTDQTIALLQQLCLLASKTDSDRLSCVSIVGSVQR